MATAGPPYDRPRGTASVALPALLILLALLAAYAPALRGGFVWDDDAYVTANETLRSLDGLRQIWLDPAATPQYYPLVHTTYWVEYHLWGLHPLGYHLVNVLLHGLGAVLLWTLLRRLEVPGAWLAAAIFALHPVHVESVAWITERKNVLSGVFYLAALLAYLRFEGHGRRATGEQRDRRFYVLLVVLYGCALLSKTVTFSLPAAILLLIWWKKGRLEWRDAIPVAPLIPIGVAMGSLTLWMETHHVGTRFYEWDLSVVDRILIAGRAIWFYAAKLAFPFELLFFYPRWRIDASVWWQYLYPLAAVVVILTLWFLRARIGRSALVAVLFFCGTLTPALGFFNVYPMRFSFVADHFQYLASIGLTTLFAAWVAVTTERLGRRFENARVALRTVPAVVIVLALGLLTWRQAHVYRDIETLWRRTLAGNPAAWLAHYNLAGLLAERGDSDEAIEHYRDAINIRPDYFEAHHNLGLELMSQGRTLEAMAHYNESIRIRPEQPEAHNTLGMLLLAAGETEDAVERFHLALRYDPGYWRAHLNMGLAMETLGDRPRADLHYARALEVAPDSADVRTRYGAVLARGGRLHEALEQLAVSLRLDPDNPETHCVKGDTLLLQNRTQEAIDAYRAALRIDESYERAVAALARIAAESELPPSR
jgi:tetratricopeptide (TPR) repeat protein